MVLGKKEVRVARFPRSFLAPVQAAIYSVLFLASVGRPSLSQQVEVAAATLWLLSWERAAVVVSPSFLQANVFQAQHQEEAEKVVVAVPLVEAAVPVQIATGAGAVEEVVRLAEVVAKVQIATVVGMMEEAGAVVVLVRTAVEVAVPVQIVAVVVKAIPHRQTVLPSRHRNPRQVLNHVLPLSPQPT